VRVIRNKIENTGDAVLLYHVVYKHEGFVEVAQTLFELVKRAQQSAPGKRRLLYLDIEGHRNEEGGFDSDMLEIQKDFLFSFLGKYVSEIRCPLINATHQTQIDSIPAEETV